MDAVTLDQRCIIIGAGPAGLTAAYELAGSGTPTVVFEADALVGGISRTDEYAGYRFDVGGHRFFTKVPRVESLWHEVLGDEFLVRPRLSRIYYNDRFFDYPLKPMNALRGLGLLESLRVGLSYARAQLAPSPEERSFEQWVTNRFGRRLYEIFFKTYTEKVWGIPCSEIGADWAAQRIKNLDLKAAVRNALVGSSRDGTVITTLIDRFHYPRLGPGMMWERVRDVVAAAGVETHLETTVVRVHHADGRVTGVTVRDRDGRERFEPGSHVLSSMPLRTLMNVLDPAPPAAVLEAANALRYRDFLTIVLIVDREDVFPDNWIYIHSDKVQLGRIQNFKNWSPEMVPDPTKTSLGLEYFVQENDDLWAMADADLVALGRRECAALGLIEASEVLDGTVIRMPKAYPVYDAAYKASLATLREWLGSMPTLQCVGRNGQHRYNNQDHSMLTAMLAAERVHGAAHDIWNVNVEADYHEAVTESREGGDRLVPGAVPDVVTAELVRSIFARYDPVALGAALGLVSSLTLALATLWLVVKGGPVVGPTLGLLSHYLVGYSVTATGALVGAAELLALGFAFGYGLARTINVVVGWQESAFRRQLELMNAFE